MGTVLYLINIDNDFTCWKKAEKTNQHRTRLGNPGRYAVLIVMSTGNPKTLPI